MTGAASRRLAVVVLQVGTTGAVLAALVILFGAEPLRRAAGVLAPGTVLAAVVLGAVVTVVQAARWQVVCAGYGLVLAPWDALAQVYQASFLNAVLPGGLVGDAVRAVRLGHSTGARYGAGVGSVAGERLAGTVVVLGAAALACVPVSAPAALLVAGAAAVALLLARPSLRRLGRRTAALVWLLSACSWCALASLFLVAATVTLPGLAAWTALALAALCLAGMAVPLNVGGWGPREAVTSVAALGYGLAGSDGLAVAAAYGLLALVSTVPGALVLAAALLRARRGSAGPAVPEGQLGAHVAAQQELPRRRGEGL